MLKTYFKKIKVVELASVLAGPLVGSFLSELGCEVIKIENKRRGGDVTRQWKNINEGPSSQVSAYYHAANFNKQSVLLDLNEQSNRDQLDEYVAGADIVLSNYLSKVSLKFGIHPNQLRMKYPKLIIVQLDAFAKDQDIPGFDMVMQAETGYLSMSGTVSGEATRMPVAMMDVLASHQMKEGLLLALLHRQMTGEGSIVNVSLYKSGISALVNQGTNYLNTGLVAGPMGTLHPNIAPYGDMITSAEGRQVMLAIGSDHQFKVFVSSIGKEALLQDYVSNKQRIERRNELMTEINAATRAIGYDTLVALLKDKGIPYGEMKRMNEVFEHPLSKTMVLDNNNGGKSISNIAFTLEN